MVYFIISLIILIVVYLFTEKITNDEDSAASLTVLVMFILAFVPLINLLIGTYSEEQEIKLYDIQGLEIKQSNEATVNGVFMLGCGVVNSSNSSDLKYVFFSDELYGKQLKSLSIKDTYLKETDDEQPQAKEIRKIHKKKINIIDKIWGEEEDIEFYSTVERTILIVPTNTIKIEYNVEI